MPKRNIPNYRLHKATGQAFVELGGRRFYLGKHGSKASRELYEQRIAEHLANGRRLPPTKTMASISCQELAVHYIVFEHQSTSLKKIPRKLLKYISAIWESEAKEGKPLSAPYFLVLRTGKKPHRSRYPTMADSLPKYADGEPVSALQQYGSQANTDAPNQYATLGTVIDRLLMDGMGKN